MKAGKKKMMLKLRRLFTQGAATLLMSLILIMVSTIVIIFAANYGLLADKAITNITRSNQAFEAAQAGLEFGINYLNKRSSTILSSTSNGYINSYSDSSTSNVTLANNSKYTITYSNPVAYNYTIIKITSTGTSDDGTATKTVSQLVKFGSMLLNAPTKPLFAKGSVAMGSGSQVENDYSNYTIDSASTVTLSGTASTVLASGISSTAGNLRSDITQNNATLGALSSADYFVSYFGLPDSMIKSSVGNYYSNTTDTSYRTQVSGKTGTSIWIDQSSGTSAIINGFVVVGSSSDPVLMIINGNNIFTGFVLIYGFVYVNGTNTIASGANVQIIGGLSSTGSISGPGAFQVYYSPSVLSNLQSQSSMRYYAKIPGSWKDF